MNSPVDPRQSLVAMEIEPGLRAWKCESSGGYFIAESDYWRWLANSEERRAGLPEPQAIEVEEDADQPARLCPATGRIMIRCKVGHGLRFSIERSPGGFWLDAGEWEALRGYGLHDELHHVFTREWQYEVRHEAAREALLKGFAERVGEADFEHAMRVKDWLGGHPRRSEILAWLMADGGP